METSSSIPRSGGKLVRPRRTAAARTPYDRPPPPSHRSPISGSQNPNWISRLILSPSRMLATGAGKVLASVFSAEPSSSSSSSDAEYTSDDVGGDNEAISSPGDELTERERPDTEWKSETKRLIAELLMQETLSREEYDKLVYIMQSRVVDSLVAGGTEDGRLSVYGDETIGRDVAAPDLRDTAISEAKRWLEGKKSGSNSKSELEYGTCTLDTAMLPHAAEAEFGSPVDLAKSYMQARPPWASPTANHIQLKSPSQLFKATTPHSFASISSSKLNMETPATGSWNIQEELRKVRSRATEEMLKTRHSSKIDWPASTSNYKIGSNLFETGKIEVATRDKKYNPTHLVDVPLDWSSAVTLNGRPEGILTHGHQLQPSEDALVAAQSAAGSPKETAKNREPFIDSSMVGGTGQDAVPDSKFLELNCSINKEAAGRSCAVAANGFPSPALSFPAGHESKQNYEPSNEEHNPATSNQEMAAFQSNEEHNPVSSGQDKMATSTPGEETCHVLSEASFEVPINDSENAVAASPSQNSSSLHDEGLSRDATRPGTKRSSATGKTRSPAETQPVKKVSRYNRRGRGRGKY